MTQNFDRIFESVEPGRSVRHMRGTASVLIKGDVGAGAQVICAGGGARLVIKGAVRRGALIVCMGADASIVIKRQVEDGTRIASFGTVDIRGWRLPIGKAAILCNGTLAAWGRPNPGAYIRSQNFVQVPADCKVCTLQQNWPGRVIAASSTVNDRTAELFLEAEKGHKRRQARSAQHHNHPFIDWAEVERLLAR